MDELRNYGDEPSSHTSSGHVPIPGRSRQSALSKVQPADRFTSPSSSSCTRSLKL